MVIINKINLVSNYSKNIKDAIKISAKNNIGINKIKKHLIKFTKDKSLTQNEIIVTNIRHYEELKKTLIEVSNVIKGLDNNISSDLLSINIRQSLYHLGCITGNVTTDDLLGNIFSKFCIGK